jgi:hypothetical protein
MDSTAMAMEERVKIEDKVASAILNVSSGSGVESSRADDAHRVSSDAEVRFLVFCG